MATKTWLPVSPDYKERNVKLQEGNSISHLNIFKDLVKLRQKKSFTEGDFNRLYTPNNEEVLLYTRLAYLNGKLLYLLFIQNFIHIHIYT